MVNSFTSAPARHLSIMIMLLVLVVAGMLSPAAAQNSTTATGLPVYCLAPDGMVKPPPWGTTRDTRPHWYIGLNSDPSEYVGDVITYRTGVNYGPHPTAFGSMDEHGTLTFTALDNPGSTTEQSNTGDIRFFGIAFRNESGLYTESPTPVFAMYIGPSREVIEGKCGGTFYDSAGHLRTADDIYWVTAAKEPVPQGGHEYATPQAMAQPRAASSS